MPRQIICIFLAALLSGVDVRALQTPPKMSGPVKSQVQALGPNSLVEVRPFDGAKLRGWIGTISENSFELRLGNLKLESRSLGFDQVRSVRPVKSLKPSHTGRNILIGAGIAVAAIAVGILIAAKKAGYL